MIIKRRFCTLLAWGGALLFLAGPLRFAAEEQSAGQGRVVAVGDVHGALPEFVSILERVGLIDAQKQWMGGAAVLVQTGDVPDRGPQSRQALDLLMDLEAKAEKQKGKVIPLLGNHEVMNMIGDLRYVSADDYQAFATDQSGSVRDKAFGDYMNFVAAHRSHGHPAAPDDEASRQKWMAEHPLGFFERHDAFAPAGTYGRWLRQHDAVGQVDDVLFMHGGLSPKLHFKNVEDLNKRVRSELAEFDSLWKFLTERKLVWRYMTLPEALHDAQEELASMKSGGGYADRSSAQKLQQLLELQTGLLMSNDSPLWYRGLALEDEKTLSRDVDKMLGRLKVRAIVAGHTVRPKFDITPRFDNRVFLIDTGMLKAFFGGRASALEIQNGRFTAYYADGQQQVLVGGAAGAASTGKANGEQKQ